MPKFSATSKKRLETCHPDLQQLMNEVIKHFDCTVLCGHRDKSEQDLAFREGKSKTPWPKSKHNKFPSLAVDVVPYPIFWEDTNRMRFFAGFVLGTAKQLGIQVRWGGDWDQDTEVKDNAFQDLPHFELVDEK